MPQFVEIDSPSPGDTVGRPELVVSGDYDLGPAFVDEIPPNTKIECRFLTANDTPAQNPGGAVIGPQFFEPITLVRGPWQVTFTLNRDFDNHKVVAKLILDGDVVDTDTVQDL